MKESDDMDTLYGMFFYGIPGIVIAVFVGYGLARLLKGRLPPQE
jgi:hypothetical protein